VDHAARGEAPEPGRQGAERRGGPGPSRRGARDHGTREGGRGGCGRRIDVRRRGERARVGRGGGYRRAVERGGGEARGEHQVRRPQARSLARCPGRDGRRGREARSRRAARRRARRFPRGLDPEDARQVHVHRAAAMGGGGVGRPGGERRGRPRVRGRARARRPRPAARASARWRKRRERRRRPPRRRRGAKRRRRRGRFVFARARVPRSVRVDVPRGPDGARAHRRAAPSAGLGGQGVAREKAGRRMARGASRRVRRAPRRRLPFFLRRLPGARRALLRAFFCFARGRGRGSSRVRRERA
jgi:hypothetical protein